MRAARVYRSFEEFEREELRAPDRLDSTIDEMLDQMFADGLDFDDERRRPSDDE
jgi:hypothetical protein